MKSDEVFTPIKSCKSEETNTTHQVKMVENNSRDGAEVCSYMNVILWGHIVNHFSAASV